MNFAEELPDACPPSDAKDVPLTDVYRLSHTDNFTEGEFASHAALGRTPPKSLNDMCRWSSCSLTTHPVVLKKLRKLKHRFALKLSIPAGAGVSKRKEIHVDFWRYEHFDPSTAVVTVEDI
jgi:hypothetical protein